ncbi:hypothetical protein PV08_04376 [Exophiala spinifera]|uniref:Uncharacterized protein n=1 Tax=Exophiala spinifera TaxID=91928 RepID=A0A0D2BEX6_9EURO|nr:uncharacterized protein PV08_04376 [Exophiala spinifera]KIW17185.1 hypothetical protein PV08_04376 [Exophiala spinifera]
MATPPDQQISPTKEQWDQLCQDVKKNLTEEMGSETWYLIIATALTVSPRPHLLADFWTHITTHDPSFGTADSRSRLSTRLGDTLIKQLTLSGAPQVLSALIPLAKAQTQTPSSSSSDGQRPTEEGELDIEAWSSLSLPDLHARGIETITSIYGTLWRRIFATFGPYRKDMGLHELGVVYGLYLSDFTHLSPLETETVAYTNITCQGLAGPSLWHVRGMGRVLGARGTDEADARVARAKDVIRGVKVAVATAVEFVGDDFVRRSRLDGGADGTQGWPNVGDVSRDLGGWGEDDDISKTTNAEERTT